MSLDGHGRRWRRNDSTDGGDSAVDLGVLGSARSDGGGHWDGGGVVGSLFVDCSAVVSRGRWGLDDRSDDRGGGLGAVDGSALSNVGLGDRADGRVD